MLLVEGWWAVGGRATEEWVGTEAKAKEGIHSEGASEEAFVMKVVDPLFGSVASFLWCVLTAVYLISLLLNVDRM